MQDDTSPLFLGESTYNLTCLPSGDWSLPLFPCVKIVCPPVVFEEKSVKQEVHEDPLNNRVGYKTEFTLSCIKKKDVFLFGEKLTEVDYYCNRR